MDLSKFTIKSQEAIQEAQNLAITNQNQAIESGHLLKAIFNVDENVLPFLLKKLSVNVEIFEKALDQVIKSYPKVEGASLYMNRSASEALNHALQKSKKW